MAVGNAAVGGEMITETHDLLTIKELQNEVKRLRKELAGEQKARQSLADLCEKQLAKIQRLEKGQRG